MCLNTLAMSTPSQRGDSPPPTLSQTQTINLSDHLNITPTLSQTQTIAVSSMHLTSDNSPTFTQTQTFTSGSSSPTLSQTQTTHISSTSSATFTQAQTVSAPTLITSTSFPQAQTQTTELAPTHCTPTVTQPLLNPARSVSRISFLCPWFCAKHRKLHFTFLNNVMVFGCYIDRGLAAQPHIDVREMGEKEKRLMN